VTAVPSPPEGAQQPDGAVVVGVDDGTGCARALEAGVDEARRLGRPLHLVHATGVGVARWTQDRLRAQQEVTERWHERALELGGDLAVTHATHVEDAAAALVTASGTASVVVVDAGSSRRLASVLLGATVQKVAAYARCPVLVTPHEGEWSRTGPVVVGVDAAPHSVPAVAWAFSEAAARGAPVDAVHTWWWEEPDPFLTGGEWESDWRDLAVTQEAAVSEMLAGWTERYPEVPVTTRVVRGQAATMLREYAADAQLLVVGTRGRGGFAGLLLGSVSSSLVHSAPCPVVVVPHDSDRAAEA
jgi:nucleotide-binding universal stress UspA family protein